ncbi:YggT family protein [Alcanivoracaceae bacterium MT1]
MRHPRSQGAGSFQSPPPSIRFEFTPICPNTLSPNDTAGEPMNPQGAAIFLINVAFSIYIFIVLTRFVLQLARADFYNPISQFVLRATNPLLAPLRRIIPGWRGLDIASLVLVVILIIAKVLVLSAIHYGSLPSGLGPQLLIYTLRELASLILNYVFWMVLIRVILSWIAPDPYNPMVRVIVQITEPIMAPARRLLPDMGGLDLSPLIVLLGVQLLKILFQLH